MSTGWTGFEVALLVVAVLLVAACVMALVVGGVYLRRTLRGSRQAQGSTDARGTSR